MKRRGPGVDEMNRLLAPHGVRLIKTWLRTMALIGDNDRKRRRRGSYRITLGWNDYRANPFVQVHVDNDMRTVIHGASWEEVAGKAAEAYKLLRPLELIQWRDPLADDYEPGPQEPADLAAAWKQFREWGGR